LQLEVALEFIVLACLKYFEVKMTDRRGEIKKTANALEKKLAKDLGIRRISGSGSIVSWKGDLESPSYLIDSKNTETPIITIQSADLAKITREAREAGKIMGHLILTFLPYYNWALVPYINIEFESTEEYIECKGSKKISKSQLMSAEKRALKKNKPPSILFFFEKLKFGTPNKWLLIPMSIYEEQYVK
jgi:hypothetical protein